MGRLLNDLLYRLGINKKKVILYDILPNGRIRERLLKQSRRNVLEVSPTKGEELGQELRINNPPHYADGSGQIIYFRIAGHDENINLLQQYEPSSTDEQEYMLQTLSYQKGFQIGQRKGQVKIDFQIKAILVGVACVMIFFSIMMLQLMDKVCVPPA